VEKSQFDPQFHVIYGARNSTPTPNIEMRKTCSVENMPKSSIVILSAAKNLRQNGRSFASLRMTTVGFQQSKKNPEPETRQKCPHP
jgi:hypothetical protein